MKPLALFFSLMAAFAYGIYVGRTTGYATGRADGYIEGKIAAYDEALKMLREAFPNQPEQL